ncbi:MAG: hypothetical protein UH625_03675 [Muribaculaceae bacterium]|nr:hypothetical protein [Muribaculaceae bacterium]
MTNSTSHTLCYAERRKYEIYDAGHAILYLNESSCSLTDNNGDLVAGYSYTGDMPDGGTLVEASGVTDENRRDKFVAGLIGRSYDMDAQIAVLANGNDTPEHAAELEQFARMRAECKKAVDEMLNR